MAPEGPQAGFAAEHDDNDDGPYEVLQGRQLLVWGSVADAIASMAGTPGLPAPTIIELTEDERLALEAICEDAVDAWVTS